MAKNLKLEFIGGKVYRLYVEDSDRFDIVRYISEVYRKDPEDFKDVVVEILYDVNHPLTAKDKNFIKWRVKSFTAGNINVTFTENVEKVREERKEKVIPLRQPGEKKVVSPSMKLPYSISGSDSSGIDMDSRGILIKLGTMRSGTEVKSQTGVLVIGDVHVGADIYSEGPVYILGNLSGRIFLRSPKAYAIVKNCIDGVVIYNGRVYDCQSEGQWVLYLPTDGELDILAGKIGDLARRVKKWQEEL